MTISRLAVAAFVLVLWPGEARPAPAAQAPAGPPSADPTGKALRDLVDAFPPEGSPAPTDPAVRARLCELWLAYTREWLANAEDKVSAGWYERYEGSYVLSPGEYSIFAREQALNFGSLGPEVTVASRIANTMFDWRIVCPPEKDKPASATGGGRRNLLIAGGVVALGSGIAVAAGGGDGSRSAVPSSSVTGPAPTPAPTPTPDTTPIRAAGDYRITLTLLSDPAGQASSLALPSEIVLTFSVSGENLRVTCPPGARWIPTNGPFDAGSGRFSTSAIGPLAGADRVAHLEGQVNRQGRLVSTTYSIESGGRSTVYMAEGSRQ